MTAPTNDNLLEGIAPKKISHELPSVEKKFRGWHKPRKQFVRRNQWLGEVEALIPCLRLDGKLLRYFTLPGPGMLDVRLLMGFCIQKGLRLSPLGFNEELSFSSPTEFNISSNEVRNDIEPCSITILPDNLSVLKSTTSQGFMYVRDKGPFDVINLDLCSSISCIDYPDNHQVLNNLCEYQVNNRTEPWLLFITTRAEYDQVNLGHLPSYLQRVRENAIISSTFADRLTAITGFTVGDYDGIDVPDYLIKLNDGFVRLFASGLAKWLLKLMLDRPFKWTVEMLDSYWYRVEDNQSRDSFPNMLSLAFKFCPVNISLNDSSGLATSNPSPEVNEETLALAILEKLETLIDLDKKIDEDSSLYDELLKESVALLKAARYPIDKYTEWAAQKRIRFYEN
jgi:hypothetical protein